MRWAAWEAWAARLLRRLSRSGLGGSDRGGPDLSAPATGLAVGVCNGADGAPAGCSAQRRSGVGMSDMRFLRELRLSRWI